MAKETRWLLRRARLDDSPLRKRRLVVTRDQWKGVHDLLGRPGWLLRLAHLDDSPLHKRRLVTVVTCDQWKGVRYVLGRHRADLFKSGWELLLHERATATCPLFQASLDSLRDFLNGPRKAPVKDEIR